MAQFEEVVTIKDHHCRICGKLIPRGSRCFSQSKMDVTGSWTTVFQCPDLSCYFTPEDRENRLIPKRGRQERLEL